MGGFVGRTGRAPVDDSERARLEKALDSLTHRGPHGRFVRVNRGTFLGFCQQVGETEQPCLYGDWEVLFDGALQNNATLVRRLAEAGQTGEFRSDAEVAAAWIATYGPTGLPDLEGIFAIAAVHRKTGDALLARDRFGVVPTYVAEVDGRLLFASEPRALCAASPQPFSTDLPAVASFLTMGQTQSLETCWHGVWRLPPGSYLRWQAETAIAAPTVWYQWPPAAEPIQLASSQAQRDEALECLLQKLVNDSLNGPVPPGVLVNADVGSALLAYYAVQGARAAGRSPPVLWTLGLPGTPAEVDAAHAIGVARHVGAPHTVVDWDINAPFDFELLARTFDEPCADVSSYLFCILGQQAREHGTVWLTGSGATSAFLGAAHQLASLQAYASPWRAPVMQGIARQGKAFCSPFSPLRRILDRATLPAALLPQSFTTLPHASALRHVLTVEANEHVEVAHQKWVEMHAEPVEKVSPAQLRLLDIRTLQPMRQLLKLDRAAHAVGQQWRLPWYDARLLNYAAALPESDLLENGMGAQPLRRLARKRLPQSVAALQRGPAAVSFKHLLHPAQDRSLLARVHETPMVRSWIDPEKLAQLLKFWRQAPATHLDGTVWRCTALAVWLERYGRLIA